jgi:hypothetical protein
LRDIPVNHVHSGDIITLVDLKDGKTYTGMVTFNGKCLLQLAGGYLSRFRDRYSYRVFDRDKVRIINHEVQLTLPLTLPSVDP